MKGKEARSNEGFLSHSLSLSLVAVRFAHSDKIVISDNKPLPLPRTGLKAIEVDSGHRVTDALTVVRSNGGCSSSSSSVRNR